MLKLISLLIVTVFLFTGCAGVEVYTFKKDRVDQTLKGNEGYISGDRPDDEPRPERSSKRTLIGVDVEIGEMSAEEETEGTSGLETAPAMLPDKQESASITGGAAERTEGTGGAETIVVDKENIETEEDWIK